MIRDIGELKLTLYMEGVSTPPVYRGSFGGNRWIGFPPKLPPKWGGGTYKGAPLELAEVRRV